MGIPADRVRILVLCTGNSARSQIAEAFLRSFDPNLEVRSAGTEPASRMNPCAVRVMKEIGIDISGSRPKHVDQFVGQSFHWLITVCSDAERSCPAFSGEVKHRVHIGFDDPASATGSGQEVLGAFRRVRDEIRERIQEFYQQKMKGNWQESWPTETSRM